MGRDGYSRAFHFATPEEAIAHIDRIKAINEKEMQEVNTYYDCGHSGYASFDSEALSGMASCMEAAEEECAKKAGEMGKYKDNYLHVVTKQYKEHVESKETEEDKKRKRSSTATLETAFDKVVSDRKSRKPVTNGDSLTCVVCQSTILIGPATVATAKQGICPACKSARTLDAALPGEKNRWGSPITRWVSRRSLYGADDDASFAALSRAVDETKVVHKPVLMPSGKTRVLVYEDACSGHC